MGNFPKKKILIRWPIYRTPIGVISDTKYDKVILHVLAKEITSQWEMIDMLFMTYFWN